MIQKVGKPGGSRSKLNFDDGFYYFVYDLNTTIDGESSSIVGGSSSAVFVMDPTGPGREWQSAITFFWEFMDDRSASNYSTPFNYRGTLFSFGTVFQGANCIKVKPQFTRLYSDSSALSGDSNNLLLKIGGGMGTTPCGQNIKGVKGLIKISESGFVGLNKNSPFWTSVNVKKIN